MTVTQLRKMAGNTIFSVTFRKRSDGSERRMCCRFLPPTGGDPAYDAKSKYLAVVWDMDRSGWRSIPVEGIIRLRVRGVEWERTR